MKIRGYENVRYGVSAKAKSHSIKGWNGIVPAAACGVEANLLNGFSLDVALTNDPVDCARCIKVLSTPTTPKEQPNFSHKARMDRLRELAEDIAFKSIYCPYFADAAGAFIKDNDESMDAHSSRVWDEVKDMLNEARALVNEIVAHGFDRERVMDSYNRKIRRCLRDCRRTVPECSYPFSVKL